MSLSLALRLALAVGFAVPALGQAEVPAMVSAKPVKVSAADAAGPVFKGVFAAKDTSSTDGPATDVVMLRSKDKRMTVGLYKAGPSESDIAAYPEDEFFYLLEGAITLTSADGSVVAAKAGEGVAIPKGWKGHWSTRGYRKYYVVYETPAGH
jgi:uncharacterized cupin superfamily protein